MTSTEALRQLDLALANYREALYWLDQSGSDAARGLVGLARLALMRAVAELPDLD